jgi:hypothetical protein
MFSHEDEPRSDPTPEMVAPASDAASDERRPSPSAGAVWVWTVILAAGLAAGLGSWFLSESIYGRFRAQAEASQGFPTIEQSNANELKNRAGITTETSLTFATLGALLGLALGAAGGVLRGSTRSAVTAGASGLIFGALGGFAAGRLFTPLYHGLYRPDGNDLGLAILTQGGIAAVVGALAGGAFGLGLSDGGRRLDFRFVVGGLLGAVAGAVVYEIAGAIAFPFDGTTLPVSARWVARLVDHVAIAGLAAVGVALAWGPRARTA